MGCGASSQVEDGGETRAPRPVNRPVEVVWEVDEGWKTINQLFLEKTEAEGEEGKEIARASQQPHEIFTAVRSWIGNRYPDCARAGTIEEMEESGAGIRTTEGCCNWPSKQFVTLDSCFTGVMLASSFIIAVPLKEGEAWPTPGAMLNTPEMEGAKKQMVTMFQMMEQQQFNMDHTEIHIFMGADMVRGKWRPSTKEPTINMFQDKPTREFKKSNDQVAKMVRKNPGEAKGQYLPVVFNAILKRMHSTVQGATVWDEGELPFQVNGIPYPYATRVLVTRDFSQIDRGVEATHYKVAKPDSDLHKDVLPRLSRNAEPEKDPGGIVHVMLVCAISPDILWPLCGDFAKKPEIKAAETALFDLLKKWNREGKVQRCLAELAIGADKISYSFVGEKFDAPIPTDGKNLADLPKKIEGDIEGFSIRMLEQPKHELFESEGHFQAIKAIMRERMLQNPERYKALAQETAKATVCHFLEKNYPGCEVTYEGEFTTTVDGIPTKIPDTVLSVARDPKKEKNNIIAAIYSIPLPNGELQLPNDPKSWVNSQEMKDAVAALLVVMKQWYKEGKISDDDCMAQVMIGVDVDTYQFLDGERFEDYSEERMKQFNWG
jgi:hypothetical protein